MPPEYKHAYVMVRSDAHAVWRGDEMNQTLANELVGLLCGYSSQLN
jgi:hypothetical protein